MASARLCPRPLAGLAGEVVQDQGANGGSQVAAVAGAASGIQRGEEGCVDLKAGRRG